MPEPFIGEIRIFASNFAPAGWALCQGQALPISGNEGLFNLIRTRYGGDGQSTFALPDLRSRVPVHMGPLSGRTFSIGEKAGAERVTLAVDQIPSHNHNVGATTGTGTDSGPAGHILAAPPAVALYNSNPPNQSADPRTIGSSGSGQPHNNMQPFLVVNFIICVRGIYPSRP